MADTIDLPKIGKVNKNYVYAGVAVVIGIVGYAYWKRNAGAKEDTGFDPNAIDPLTGLPYSASLSGSDSYSNPAPSVTQAVIDNSTDTIDTNAEWSNVVTTKLGEIGYESSYVAIILGKYLGGQQLTKEEADIIRTAWAYYGHPPVDKAIILTTTPTTTPTEDPFKVPLPGATGPHTTGVIKDPNATLEGLATLYWGDAKYASRIYYANIQKIAGNGGKILGLDLYIPPDPRVSS